MSGVLEQVRAKPLARQKIRVMLGEPTIHYSPIGCGCDKMESCAQLYVIDPTTNQIMRISGSHPILRLMGDIISFELTYTGKEDPPRDPIKHIDTVLKKAILDRLHQSHFSLEIKDPNDEAEIVQVKFIQDPPIPGLELRHEFRIARSYFE